MYWSKATDGTRYIYSYVENALSVVRVFFCANLWRANLLRCERP